MSQTLECAFKGTQILSDSFLRYENYDFKNFTMQDYMILVSRKYLFTNIKDNINIKDTVMHFETLLKDDPLRVLSVSMCRRIVKTKSLLNRVPYVLYVPSCLACPRALVPTCFACPRALRALVPCLPSCLACPRALVPCMPYCLCGQVIVTIICYQLIVIFLAKNRCK